MPSADELINALNADPATQRQIVEKWMALNEAQEQSEATARGAAEASRRAEIAARNQVRIHEALLSDVGRLIQQVSLSLAGVREFQEEIGYWTERFDYKQGLILAGMRFLLADKKIDQEQLEEIIRQIEQTELDLIETEEIGLRKRLMIHRQNLNNLQVQAAAFGATSTPLYLLNQIAGEERYISELQEQIEQIMKSRS
jgi:hypothetical protein